MKKLMMAVMGAVLALGTFADGMSVEYLDENGCLQTNETAMVVTADTTTLETGWYVVTGEVSRGGIDVAPGCTANLILADGASLTVQGAYMGAGFNVSAGETLNVYGQREGTGLLAATGGYLAAGIGGGDSSTGGSLTINGGTVAATGGEHGAGIGGGSHCDGGKLSVNGGTVMATGGNFAAGIGGGHDGSGGVVTINGGAVTAVGGTDGAGIGGGFNSNCDEFNGKGGYVTINGGSVDAAAGDSWAAGEFAAGIGGGALSVDDGTVAFGENVAGGVWTDDGVMSLDEYAADHGAKSVALPVAVVSIPHVNGLAYVVSNGTEEVFGYMAGKNVYAAATGDTLRVYFTLIPGCSYITEPPENPMEISVDGWSATVEAKDMPQVSVPAVEYFDWDGKALVKKSATDYTFVTGEMSAFEAGRMYVVAGEVVRRGGIVADGTPDAPTYLILCDGAKLTVTGTTKGNAALRVASGGVTTNALVICGQTEGSGELTVTNLAMSAAAIGGDDRDKGTDTADCGIVTINGGTVTATGGSGGAGIGGGYAGNGGVVTVNGGTVTATGDGGGAGVGGGLGGTGGTVTINGGTVTATGGYGGAGIGGGSGGTGGTVTLGNRVEVVEGACGSGSNYVKLAEKKSLVVTVGELQHVTAAWTSGEGTVTNAIGGTVFEVPMGATGVKVVFTPERNYRFKEAHETGVRPLASPLKEACTVTPPEVEGIPGTVANPWTVGESATAYVSDDGTLVIGGTGAMYDFASAADVPWAKVAGAVKAVTVAEGVSKVGKNAFAEMADTVTVNGTSLSFYDMMAEARGVSDPIIPEDMVLVSKTELQAANAETVTVDGGTAYLSVTVLTNGDLTAEIENWGKAAEHTFEIPANADNGFMILRSKSALPSK